MIWKDGNSHKISGMRKPDNDVNTRRDWKDWKMLNLSRKLVYTTLIRRGFSHEAVVSSFKTSTRPVLVSIQNELSSPTPLRLSDTNASCLSLTAKYLSGVQVWPSSLMQWTWFLTFLSFLDQILPKIEPHKLNVTKIDCPTASNVVKTTLNDPDVAKKEVLDPLVSPDAAKIDPLRPDAAPKMAHRLLKIKKRKMKVHRRKRRLKKYAASIRKYKVCA